MTPTVTGRNVVGHSLCEWDPANNRPAEGIPVKGGYEKYTGCANDAALVVGSRET